MRIHGSRVRCWKPSLIIKVANLWKKRSISRSASNGGEGSLSTRLRVFSENLESFENLFHSFCDVSRWHIKASRPPKWQLDGEWLRDASAPLRPVVTATSRRIWFHTKKYLLYIAYYSETGKTSRHTCRQRREERVNFSGKRHAKRRLNGCKVKVISVRLGLPLKKRGGLNP